MHEARELGMPRLATIVEGGEAADLVRGRVGVGGRGRCRGRVRVRAKGLG